MTRQSKPSRRRPLRCEFLESRHLLAAALNASVAEAEATGDDHDIVIRDLVAPAEVTTEAWLPFEALIENTGSGDLITPEWDAYLSKDAVFDDQDTRIGGGSSFDWRRSADGSAASLRENGFLPLSPQDLPVGSYFLILRVNARQQVGETNYENNLWWIPIQLVDQPGLTISKLNGPSRASQGEDIRLSYQLTNPTTRGRTERSSVSLSLIDDTGRSVQSWNQQIDSFAPGSDERIFETRVPWDVPPGDYSLNLAVDGDLNPRFNRIPIQIEARPRVIISNFQFDPAQRRSDPIAVDFDVNANDSFWMTHEIYFSRDTWLDSADERIHTARLYHSGGENTESTVFLADASNLREGYLILHSRFEDDTVLAPIDLVHPIRFSGPESQANPPVIVRDLSASQVGATASLVNLSEHQQTGRVYFYGSETSDVLRRDFFFGSSAFDRMGPRSFESVRLDFRQLPVNASQMTIFAIASVDEEPSEIPDDTPSETRWLYSDLAISDLNVPDVLEAGSTVSLSIENLAPDTRASSFTHTFYLSQDAQLSDDDIVLASLSEYDDLPHGERRQVSATIESPPLYEFDGHLIVELSTAELTRENNILSAPVRTEGPRLEIIEAPPAIATGFVALEFNVLNSGSKDLDSPRFSLYFGDESARPSDNDVRVVSGVASQPVDVNQTERLDVSAYIPPEAEGAEYLFIRAFDSPAPYQRIRLDEPVYVPDLIVEDLAVTVLANGDYDVSWTTRNASSTTVETNHFYVYLTPSLDRPASHLLAEHPTNDRMTLAPGATHRSTFIIPGDDPLLLGENQSGFFIVESGDETFDSDFGNNRLTFAVQSGSAPDLEFLPVEIPQTFFSSEPTPLRIEIRNLGSEPVAPTELTARVFVTPMTEQGESFPQTFYDRTVTLAEPLAPGESVRAEILIDPYYFTSDRPGFQSLESMSEVAIRVRFDDLRFSTDHLNNEFEFVIPQVDKTSPDFRIDQAEIVVDDFEAGLVSVHYELFNQGLVEGRFGRHLILDLDRGSPSSRLESRTIDHSEVVLAPGEKLAFAEQFSLPTDAIPGLRASSDVNYVMPEPDADRSNEGFSVELELADGSLPDPQVELLSVNNDGSATIRLTNHGRLPLTQAVVSFSYSLLFGHAQARSLPSEAFDFSDDPITLGDSRELSTTIDLPLETLNEYGKLFVRSSMGTSTSESREVLSEFSPRLPFSLTSFSLPRVAIPGESLLASYVVRNLGDPVTDWSLEVIIDGEVSNIPIRENFPIGAGSEIDGLVRIMIPDDVSTSQPLTIRARASVEGTSIDAPLLERTLELVEPEEFGLAVEEVVVPDSIVPGQIIPVEWSVRSKTPSAVEGADWVDAVFLSADSILDDDDRIADLILHENSVFDATGFYATERLIKIPDANEDVPNYVIIKVDRWDRRADSSPDDNIFVMPINVTEPRLWIGLTRDTDTGISDTDNITRDTSPDFEVVVPEAGTLTVDLDNRRPPVVIQFDQAGRTTVSPGGYPYDDGTHVVSAEFVPASNSADVQTAHTTVTIDQTPPTTRSPAALSRAVPLTQVEYNFSEPVFLTTDSDQAMLRLLTNPFQDVSGVTIELISETMARATVAPTFRVGTYAVESGLTDLAGNSVRQTELQFELVDKGCAAHHPANDVDVNFDGKVSPLDVLLVVNHLANMQRFGGGSVAYPRHGVDVNCSGDVSPLDALRVFNALIRNADSQSNLAAGLSALAEGESLPGRIGHRFDHESLERTEEEGETLGTEPNVSDSYAGTSREWPAAAQTPESRSAAIDEWITLLDSPEFDVDADW
ncbi:MAG: Ig-like domain-containing protein [Planctomycetota bacterium]